MDTLHGLSEKPDASGSRTRQTSGHRRTFKNLIPGPGVYAIRNKRNGHEYVGKSKNVNKRASDHFRDLRNGKHHNPYLQNSYDHHGEHEFEVILLEKIEDGMLDHAEWYWIETRKPVYNIVTSPDQLLTRLSPGQIDRLAREKMSQIPEVVIGKIYPMGYNDTVRPEWHKFVYGGDKNPIHSSSRRHGNGSAID